MKTEEQKQNSSRTIIAVIAAIAVALAVILGIVYVAGQSSSQDDSGNSAFGSAEGAGSDVVDVDGSNVTWIGDSVSSGLTPDVLRERFPGIQVDSEPGKSFRTLSTDLSEMDSAGNLKDVVVIALGLNGFPDKDGLEETLEQFGGRQYILVYPGGGSSDQTIDVIDQLVAAHPDTVRAADWPGAADKVKDFADDGVHIGEQGANVLADTVAPEISAAQQHLQG
ncbi:MAG TPA: hypothetical protein H9870_01870 [Candidatus Corynebacterium avicola]|uniref:Uncharacterized protein n=1 Tax=Candidatus Corynebacterium avicola TaxID=2838527 RepID=A0A9D1RPN6_9CORY|nr:hypothetical protein [Candidatus Corynebacterium avicola]